MVLNAHDLDLQTQLSTQSRGKRLTHLAHGLKTVTCSAVFKMANIKQLNSNLTALPISISIVTLLWPTFLRSKITKKSSSESAGNLQAPYPGDPVRLLHLTPCKNRAPLWHAGALWGWLKTWAPHSQLESQPKIAQMWPWNTVKLGGEMWNVINAIPFLSCFGN